MTYEVIEKMFADEIPKSIFEVGCGNGGLFSDYANDKGLTVGGMDVNLSGAVLTFPAQKDNFILHNAENVPWPIPSESYDIVFTVGTLLLIPDPFPVLKEMMRICKDKIIIAEVHGEDFDEYGEGTNFVKSGIRKFYDGARQSPDYYDYRITRNYYKVFKKLGWEFEECESGGGKSIFKCKKQ